MALEKLGDRRLADARGFVRRRHGVPEIEQPLCPEVVFELKQCGEVAPELLAHTVRQTVALGAEVFGDARPLAQFDDDGVGDREQPKATRIGAQGGSHHLGIAAVVLGTARVKRSRKRSICFGLMACT